MPTDHPSPAPHSSAAPPVWQVAVHADGAAGLHSALDVVFSSPSQCTVLHGPSGAGKSLTLQAIAGLLPLKAHPANSTSRPSRIASQGRLLLDSAQGLCLPARQRHMGYVFQDYALFPHLSVRQNVAFGLPDRLHLLNPSPRLRHPQVEHWLDTLGLQDVAGQYPATLSGGQRQRTALARALCAQARALLLDEPFAALDATLRQQLRAELLALLDRTGIPLLLVTHDADDLACFGQTRVRLEHGRVQDIAHTS
ncbi:ATP-binding cassette domain-containing protein [Curvibacter sp. CHRR-16]|uniref:sulfate/molybdate ABC transporter ATP-binding protein n=1 Tax=Curvibacter sp. CHRR-16 TaxID=2835872 RepID=UPI001BDAEB28|nr:ATP-binding cassette domain-containing protein [Curvibacter sp. CHRR-16]MBT0571654.1 ATP-binding cassette domain-containing protein [Curvibacter sp. CHRR-16]